MSGKVIGKTMNFGYAGSYARQPDMIINTQPNVGAVAIPFGSVLIQGTGGVQIPTATAAPTATNFVGIASRQVQSQVHFLEQDQHAEYQPKAPVSVFQRGRINVICADKKADLYGAVYVRTTEDGAKKVGDLESTADTGKNVQLTNCQWGGKCDANGVAELVILTALNA